MVPLRIVSNISRFKPALTLNRVLADLNRGSNSLNSATEFLIHCLELLKGKTISYILFENKFSENPNALRVLNSKIFYLWFESFMGREYMNTRLKLFHQRALREI